MLHREKDMGLYALSKPLEHKPGTYWYYSSGTTNIVMRYLRSRFASDTEFLSYIRREIFEPLGIRNACFEPDMSGTPVGSSYLYMTARDFAKFGQLYLDNGKAGDLRVFPEGWVEYSAAPTSGSQGEYGASSGSTAVGNIPMPRPTCSNAAGMTDRKSSSSRPRTWWSWCWVIPRSRTAWLSGTGC